MINEDKKCIIKSKEYTDCYFQGEASYSSDLKIFNYKDVPEHLKNNTEDEIIFLDSKKGLEILVNETHKLENYISNEEPILNGRKEMLKNLYGLPIIQKYVKKYNQINPLIREPSYETNQRIIGKIFEEKNERNLV